jgi:hypothetical protein
MIERRMIAHAMMANRLALDPMAALMREHIICYLLATSYYDSNTCGLCQIIWCATISCVHLPKSFCQL